MPTHWVGLAKLPLYGEDGGLPELQEPASGRSIYFAKCPQFRGRRCEQTELTETALTYEAEK